MKILDELKVISSKIDKIQDLKIYIEHIEKRVEVVEKDQAFLKGVLAIAPVVLTIVGTILWHLLTK